jgi:hypothetical protein
MRPLILPLAIALILPAGSAAGEDVAGTSGFRIPADVASSVEEAEGKAADLRAAVDESFTAALAGATGAEEPIPALPAPTPQAVRRLASLPQPVARAVAGLLAAIRSADRLLGDLPEADRERATRAILGSLPSSARGSLSPEEGLMLRGTSPRIPASARRVAARAPAASLLLASALDRYLPAIESWADGEPGDGEGCDALDQRPLLCIGSTAANVYTEDAALLIDQGGNDIYRNSAGGAPIAAEADVTSISVAIDRGGNDTYQAPILTDETGTYSRGQGVGILGVGILVDLEGEDAYEATVPDATAAPTGGSAFGQGFGSAGVGALFDLGGADRYTVLGRDGVDDRVYTIGQGAGYLYGGTGLLVDRGSSDDHYSLNAGTVDGLIRPYSATEFPFTRQIQGQGQAYLGTGILADDGGRDALLADAEAKSHGGAYLFDPDYQPESPIYPKASVPIATIWAQGNGIFGGTGVVLTGDGPTTYASSARAVGIAQGNLLVQGYGIIGGQGSIDDLSGDDRYEAIVVAADEERYVVNEDCGCQSSAIFEPFISGVSAQGWAGAAAANGVVTDHAGNDSYLVAAHQRVEVALEDARPEAASPARIDVTSYAPLMAGQGFAAGDALGALVDESGTDTYTLRAVHTASADATRTAPGGPQPDASLLSPFRPYPTGGQGGARRANESAGILLDLGGTGDRFDARSTYSLRATPDPAEARRLGYSWPAFQGSGDGGVFAALGTEPVIMSSPSQGVCAASTGPRGFGSWSECAVQGADADRQFFDTPAQVVTQAPDAQRLAFGAAPGASGASPGLALTPDVPAVAPADSWLVPGVRLTDPQGSPISGATIRFDLQFGLAGGAQGLERSWFNGWEAEGLTDADGIARAGLPLDIATLDEITGDFPTNWDFRIMASFDGGPGLHPRRVAQPLQIA